MCLPIQMKPFQVTNTILNINVWKLFNSSKKVMRTTKRFTNLKKLTSKPWHFFCIMNYTFVILSSLRRILSFIKFIHHQRKLFRQTECLRTKNDWMNECTNQQFNFWRTSRCCYCENITIDVHPNSLYRA